MKISLVPNMEKYIADAEMNIDRHYLANTSKPAFLQLAYAKKIEEAKAFSLTGDIGPLINAEFIAKGTSPAEIASSILAKSEEQDAIIAEIEQKRLSAKARVRACKSQFEIRAVLQPLGVPEN